MTEDPRCVNLQLDSRSSATIHVVPLEDHRYRIVDPLIAMVSETIGYGDIIEADAGDDDKLVVRRVVENGDFKTFEFCLPEGWADLPAIQAVLARAQRLGGDWAGVFGGILMISLPSEVDHDPSKDILAAYESG